jgi:hypothetical protein
VPVTFVCRGRRRRSGQGVAGRFDAFLGLVGAETKILQDVRLAGLQRRGGARGSLCRAVFALVVGLVDWAIFHDAGK